jgi:hypothetical protein
LSVALFDLGQRLHAATLGQPVAARCTRQFCRRPIRSRSWLSAAETECWCAPAMARAKCSPAEPRRCALAELGVGIDSESRTLVVPDRDTLSRLLDLALSTDPTGPESAAAAVVGWWALRADHPGTGAVLNLPSACAARWVLGVPPRPANATWQPGARGSM